MIMTPTMKLGREEMGYMSIILVIDDCVYVWICKVYSSIFKGYKAHAFVYDSHFFSPKFHCRCHNHCRWYTFSLFQLYHVCVLQHSRWKLSIQSQYINSPPILEAALIIASWRHYLSCDDSSASQNGEPLRYTKPVAFRFLPEYTRLMSVFFYSIPH